eukprot:scaffold676_cov316-Pavlova_lutheri.AAC.34
MVVGSAAATLRIPFRRVRALHEDRPRGSWDVRIRQVVPFPPILHRARFRRTDGAESTAPSRREARTCARPPCATCSLAVQLGFERKGKAERIEGKRIEGTQGKPS